MSLNVWPEIECSESDSEDEKPQKIAQSKKIELPDGLTEEEINGSFPIFKVTNESEVSSEDEDVIGGAGDIVTNNPYLSEPQLDIKSKYSSKLRSLHLKRNEARKLNHQEVSAEDQRNKLPSNYEARRRQAEWELEDKKARKAAQDAGEDYERIKLLEETAEEVEIYENRKRKKKNIDPGFSDYAAAQLRQYDRLTKQIKPDLQVYQDSKEKLGEDVFPSAHNLKYGGDGKCRPDDVDRMVDDLNKQIEKRSKYSRRRQFYEDSDIDYINERNMKFNQKAERFYGEYTKEIRENLERGTAI